MARRLVSYVFPIYNEDGNIRLLFDTLRSHLREDEFDYEFVFVDDGSRDRSLERLIELSAEDERVLVVELSRNFGHQIAVSAGLAATSGDAVIVMDSDLQDPPQVANELIDKWLEGFEVVYAQRRSRRDSPFKRVTAAAYYRVLRRLTDVDIPPDTGDFRLMDRQVVDELLRFNEQNRFLRGMVSWIGFKQIAVKFDRDARHAGLTGYPLRKMIRFATDGVVSFSSAPLRFITHVGYLFSALSVALAIYVAVSKLVAPSMVVSGWTFTIVTILLTGGLNMVMLGVVGAYIARVYSEVQGRPLYIERARYRRGSRGRSARTAVADSGQPDSDSAQGHDY